MDKRHENRHTAPERVYKWQIRIWRDVQHYKQSGKWKLKAQWDISTHVSEWVK